MSQFVNTVLVSSIASLRKIRIGQWVQIETGSRGQYLGTTDTGVAVVRWQNGSFEKRDAINNHNLRKFATTYGSN